MLAPSALPQKYFYRRLVVAAILVTLALISLTFRFILSVVQTDPYQPQTIVETPFFTTISNDGSIVLNQRYQPHFSTNPLTILAAYTRTGFRIILYSFFSPEKPLTGNASQIIDQIHQQRFDPSKPYVITGAHYSDLYLRNLGIFFNALLDPRLPTSLFDWQNRQSLALETVAYDLSFIQASGKVVTTIVPTGKQSFTGLNIYAPPSDSLFSILYSLKALTDSSFIPQTFQISAQNNPGERNPYFGFSLQTATASAQLLSDSRTTLTPVLNDYLSSTIDPSTHLIKKTISLSSARDGVKRQSSFYDNVIAWDTVQLANELQIPHQSALDKDTWKKIIIQTFWDDQAGIFRDDLSQSNSAAPATFSADSFIVTSTGFFDLQQPADREKLQRMIAYVQAHQLDQPFPLKYTQTPYSSHLQWAVQVFAPAYMNNSIWSHWGMEYIKAELMLIQIDPTQCALLPLAHQQLNAYQQNIEKYGGYPELYTADGSFFTTPLVRGVLHTGWVVNYEEAQMMSAHTTCPVTSP